MCLELLDLPTSSQALISFNLLDSSLTIESGREKRLISFKFLLLGGLSKLILGCVVADQLEVSLAVEKESLFSILLLLLLLDDPLLAKHSLLLLDEFLLLLALDLPRVPLPVENGHGVTNLLLLLASLSHLSFELLLGVQLPELSIDLLLKHLLLDLAALIDQLLLPLDGSSVVVELSILASQSIILRLEFGILAAGDLIIALSLTLGLQGLQTLKHLLTHLLRSLHVVVELLLIDAILGGEKLGEASLALLEVSSLTAAHIGDTVADDLLLDELVGLGLPVRLVSQVPITTDVVVDLLVFLYMTKKRVKYVVHFMASE